MEFDEIHSITPTMATKLRESGVNTVESLAMQSFEELRKTLPGVAEKAIREMQHEVWKKMGYWFTPASKLSELRNDEIVLSTGCQALNDILMGGIRSRSISEFTGAFAAGKTECLLTLLVECLAKNEAYSALYFDTEESFKDIRVTEICRTRGYDATSVLDRTIYVPVWNTDHFMECVKEADSLVKSRNVKYIAVDSIIAPLRAEYVGRESLWHRQQLLNKIMRLLLNYAKAFNLVVAVSNQVVANPNVVYSMDPVQVNAPTGGNILAHGAETRIYLLRGSQGRHVARIIDSSFLPPNQCRFRITERGIEDVQEEEKK